MTPADFVSLLTPGACTTSDVKSRLCGSRSICSARMLVDLPLFLTSTIGDSAVTVTCSVMLASCRLNSTDLIDPSLTSTSPTFAGLKPERLALTSYTPGSTDGKRKLPCPSDVVDSTPLPLLLASTVAPGSTAPDESFTTPSIEPRCSCAQTGAASSAIASNAAKLRKRMNPSSSSSDVCEPCACTAHGVPVPRKPLINPLLWLFVNSSQIPAQVERAGSGFLEVWLRYVGSESTMAAEPHI